MSKRGLKRNLVSVILTLVVIGIYLVPNFASAVSVSVVTDKSTYSQADANIQADLTVTINQNERVPINNLDIMLNGGVLCSINPDGSVIGSCPGVSVTPISLGDNAAGNLNGTDEFTTEFVDFGFGYGYGYGYGYGADTGFSGILTYQVSIDKTSFPEGSYSLDLNVNSASPSATHTFSGQTSFNVVSDIDSDTIPDNSDNCPSTANADQADADSDNVGDACDVQCSTDPECDDANAYTEDSCVNPGTTFSSCSNLPITCLSDVDCDDSNDHTENSCQNPGTTVSSCSSTPIACLADAECDDSNAYTLDACSNAGTTSSSCVNEPVTCLSDIDCDDTNAGTQDSCINPGTTVSSCSNVPVACSSNAECDDTNAYTEDSCVDPATPSSSCLNEPIACLSDVDCDDFNGYTQDTCANAGTTSAACGYEPITCVSDFDCDDSDAYTLDACSNAGTTASSCSYDLITCVSNTDCDDTNDHTEDSCQNAGTAASSCFNMEIACLADSECDDTNDHTEDSCQNPGTIFSSCSNAQIACLSDVDCDDSAENTIDTCQNPGTTFSSCMNELVVCSSDIECDDTNDHTEDSCFNAGTTFSSCSNAPIACLADTECNDANDQTEDICFNAGMTSSGCYNPQIACSEDTACDDSNSLTQDLCVEPGLSTSYCLNQQVEAGNQPPTAPIVNMLPNIAYRTTNITCTITEPGIDPDGDAVEYSYKWYRNGELQTLLTANKISDSNTAKGDSWTCEVIPTDNKIHDDGTISGPSAFDSIFILNSPTVINSFTPASLTPSVAEGDSLIFSVSATDADGDLSYSWMLDGNEVSTSSSYNYTPSLNDEGTHFMLAAVSDGDWPEYLFWTIEATNVNQPPALSVPGTKTCDEGSVCELTATATDADADNILRFSDNTLLFTIEPFTGEVSFTPKQSDVGSHNVKIFVEDGKGGVASSAVAFTINNVNDAPVLDAIGTQTAIQNVQFTHDANAIDKDGDSLTYTLLSSPSGMSINANTGMIIWTPSSSQIGAHDITVGVTDGEALDSRDFILVVTDVNDPPVITSSSPSSNPTVAEPNNQVFSITKSDPDGGTPSVRWYVNNKLAEGQTSDSYTFIGSYTAAGTYAVKAVVSDGQYNDSRSWTLTVIDTNRAPTLNAPSSVACLEDSLCTINLTATDPDTNNKLVFSDNTDMFAVGLLTGKVSFTPKQANVGAHSILFKVADGSASDTKTTTLTINNVNDAPVLAPIGSKTLLEGSSYTIQTSATDEDNLTLNYSLVNAPSGMRISSIGAIIWAPTFQDSGTYNVLVRVTDGSLTASEQVAFTVLNQNLAPTITATTPTQSVTMKEDESTTFTVTASDPDGTPLTKSWYKNNQLLNGQTSNSYIFKGDFSDEGSNAGTHAIKVVASDGIANATYTWTLTVTRTRDADKDKTPDYRDNCKLVYNPSQTDADNDGTGDACENNIDGDDVPDNQDFIQGSKDNVETNVKNMEIKISDSADLNKAITDTQPVTLTETTYNEDTGEATTAPIIEFDFNFASSSSLDLGSLKVEKQKDETAGSVVIKGIDLTSQGKTKTVYVDKLAGNNYVCIKDAEIASISEMTSDCSGSNELSIACDAADHGGYKCTAEGSKYKVEGLVHSGISESSNAPPSITSKSPSSASVAMNEGASQAFSVTASDPNGDSLTYSWKLDNVQVSTTSSYTYSPDYQASGTHTLKVTASDAAAAAEFTWTVTVADTLACGSGQTRACSLQQGVCYGSLETCTNGNWPGCSYGSDYQATETSCDGKDNDCDISVDENVKSTFYRDSDGDSYGSSTQTTQACTAPSGYVSDNSDCDDSSSSKHAVVCGVCGGSQSTFYRDADGDTYGILSASTQACSVPSGYVTNSNDCNDGSSSIKPSASESCDNVDNDCDGQTDESLTRSQSCGTGECARSVTQTCSAGSWTGTCTAGSPSNEIGDDKDNDCDGQTDEGFLQTFYLDSDGDGYGTSSYIERFASTGNYQATSSGDCNDNNVKISPAIAELCDGVDSNCNNVADEREGITKQCYDAADKKYAGVGACSYGTYSCTGSAFSTDCAGDIAPVKELCNGIDDDCDGKTDEDFDADGDGFTTCGTTTDGKDTTTGTANDPSFDCRDDNKNVNKKQSETCNGIDDNCNGIADEYKTAPWADNQNGICQSSTKVCSGAVGWIEPDYSKIAGYEENDTKETKCDGRDNDCDGYTDEGHPDLDLDKSADCVDIDVDNDGISNTYDTVTGFVRNIQTNLPRIDMLIQGTSLIQSENAVQRPHFTGTSSITVKEPDNGVKKKLILHGDCDLAPAKPLRLDKFKVSKQLFAEDVGYVISNGLGCGGSLDAYVDKLNPKSNAVCIKSADISSISQISSSCDAADEALVVCDETQLSGFKCTDMVDKFKVEGFKTTIAVREAQKLPDFIRSDFNADSCINFDDFFMFAEHFSEKISDAKWDKKYDVVSNNVVDFDDFFMFANDFGKGECSGKASKPVPISIEQLKAYQNPSAEICDGLDNDKDQKVDEDLTRVQSCGIGACGRSVTQTCSAGTWTGACTPGQPSAETCDNVDNDCDGQKDESLTMSYGTADTGECSYGIKACQSGSWIATTSSVEPATEACDGKDNDCDGQVDENVKVTYYADIDRDGYGNAATLTQACSVPAGAVTNGNDCNDRNANMKPGAIEVLDGADNDCDGQVDEDIVSSKPSTIATPRVNGYLVDGCYDDGTPCDNQKTGNDYCARTFGAGSTASNIQTSWGANNQGGTIYLPTNRVCAGCGLYISSITCSSGSAKPSASENSGYSHIGCFGDGPGRAIPDASTYGYDNNNYQSKPNAIQDCANFARSKGWTTFAVQNGGWCATGPNADSTYNKYGTTNYNGGGISCSNGKGGSWANDVYRIGGTTPTASTSTSSAGTETGYDRGIGETCVGLCAAKGQTCVYSNKFSDQPYTRGKGAGPLGATGGSEFNAPCTRAPAGDVGRCGYWCSGSSSGGTATPVANTPSQPAPAPQPAPISSVNPIAGDVSNEVSEHQTATVTCPAGGTINQLQAYYFCPNDPKSRSTACPISGVGQASASFNFNNGACATSALPSGDPCSGILKKGRLIAQCAAPKPAACSLIGDFDNDKEVDWDDFFEFTNNYGGSNMIYDLKKDGKIDGDDFTVFQANFGKKC